MNEDVKKCLAQFVHILEETEKLIVYCQEHTPDDDNNKVERSNTDERSR